MPRGKHNKQNNHRGRGGGHGGGRGRGRGRGGPRGGGNPNTVLPATPAANRPPRHPYPNPNAEIDVVIQQWVEPDVTVGGNGNRNRGSGPWRGGTSNSRSGTGTPLRGVNSPRRGDPTPRATGRGRGWGRGRGRGRGQWELDNDRGPSRRPHLGVGVSDGAKARTTIGKDAPLSDLLYSERPLLRPVKFVRATLTPFLFQHSEEMLNPASDIADTTETSHVPTADRVARLFHENASDSDSESEGDAYRDALEEIDFADLAQVRAEIDAIAQSTATMDQDVHDAHEDIEEVDFADLAAIRAQVDAAKPQTTSRDDVLEEAFTGIYNQLNDTTETIDVGNKLPTPDDSLALKPSIEISNQSHHTSIPQARDTIVVEEEVPWASSGFSDALVEEPLLSTAPETHPVFVLSDDLSPPPDANPHPLFVIDTAPTLPFTNRSASDVILVDRTGHGETLGDQDEELIVYVAPHPRSGRASPVPAVPRVKLPRTSMLTGRSVEVGGLTSPIREDEDDANQQSMTANVDAGEDHLLSLAALSLGPATAASPPAHPTHTKAALRARKKAAGLRRKRQRQSKRGRMGFSAFGAMMSEARLREEDVKERRHPRWESRRRGDSDLDWGTEDEDEGEDGVEEEDGVDALSNGLGGMEIDPDLDLDVDAMRGFVKSTSAEGSRFVTIDDIEDEARMQQEDEEDQGGPEGSSDSEHSNDEEEDEEEEEVLKIEEEILIAESEDSEELSQDSDDEELSPSSNFQARLRKVRERSRNQHPKTIREISDDEEEEEETVEILLGTRSADDEEYIARINDILEENSHILAGHGRKQRKALFRNLHQGYVDEWDVEAWQDDPEFTTPVQKKKKQQRKGKDKQPAGYFDAELEALWDKDRAKKAAWKRERNTARLLAALDPLSAENGKSKGASRKAMRAAAALAIAPHVIVDTVSLEAQIRRFVEADERMSMALPPMDKGLRKVVHEMASVFGLKSVSKGKEGRRYTTLIRTSRTGWGVKEDKVRAVMKRFGGGRGGGKGGGKGGGGKGGQMPRHRDGDEVGKEAPKIGENNIGFKMLSSMGWSEGDRIGGTGSVGIEAPLTAIIKNSKLGLGATR